MPDEPVDGDTERRARESLLTKADEVWREDPALGSRDDIACYLRAYFQRVATEDLASPSRMAAVAEAHVRLGRSRPQGRALVQVREPGRAHLERVGSASLVVDIVTDDMPYLVDSVTTELNRHEAEIQLLVHPVLRVRRDVTGTLRGIVGVCEDPAGLGADELGESWMHVELGPPRDRVSADELAADLRRVLDDVRVAVEDQPRMGTAARALAAELDTGSGPVPASAARPDAARPDAPPRRRPPRRRPPRRRPHG